ncbi:unnamed protein product, partial [Nesidiocoris tenuis]
PLGPSNHEEIYPRVWDKSPRDCFNDQYATSAPCEWFVQWTPLFATMRSHLRHRKLNVNNTK